MHKGVKKLIGAGVLAFSSMLLPIVLIIPLVLNAMKDTTQLRGDLEHEFVVEEPHTYTVWNHLSGLHEGESFSFAEQLPNGISFRLINKANGEELELKSDTSTTQSSHETVVKKSVFSAEILESGTYIFSIEGNFDHGRVFSIKKSFFSSVFTALGSFFAVLLFCFLAMCGAMILGILGIVDLANKSKEQG